MTEEACMNMVLQAHIYMSDALNAWFDSTIIALSQRWCGYGTKPDTICIERQFFAGHHTHDYRTKKREFTVVAACK